MSANTVYASRKRRKPVQKSVKQVSAENAKSNPSKRHRDRLNGELELLASLLPFHQDVISKLDKLTVLRLSVGYLRAKSHFRAVLNKSNNTAKSEAKPQAEGLSEGELLLQVINGFVLVVTTNGTVFYVSSTVKDYLGFHQSDIVHQSIYKLVHTEDRAELCRQLHWALNPSNSPDSGQIVQAPQNSHPPLTYYNPELLPPENSAFLERSFVCRMRCLLDNSSGFLAMNFQGRLKFLHGQNERTAEGKLIPPQLALFAVVCPLQPPTILEIRAKNFFFRTKHKLDFTPTACDAKGKIVLGYTEAELCYRGSGYQFIHAADMLYCADNHIRMMKMGESGLTVFRLLTKHNGWVWVQANARLIYKNGRPDFIIASQRVLLDEEGEEHLKKRSLMLPFSLTTGEAVLYDASLPNSLGAAASGSDSVAAGDGNQPPPPGGLDPNSLLGSMLKQDESIYVCPAVPNNPRGFAPELEEEEENHGAIFSCNLQDGVLSFSGSPFFKKESAFVSGAEENGSELLSFMGSLGISSEDLQLLRQEELFTNVDLDEFCTFEEVTDELFSYVQESLRNKVDGTLSGDFSAELEQRNLLRRDSQTLTSGFPSEVQEMFLPNHFTPQTPQQHPPFFVEFSETTTRPQESLPTQEQWQYHQGYMHAQAQPCILTSLAQPQELSRVPLQGQVVQSSSLQLSDTSNPRRQSFYPLNHKSLQPPELSCFVPTREQLCHRLKNMHVHGNGGIPVLEGEHLPPVVQHGLQKPGDLYLETPPMDLELPYGNQVNAEFITRNQELPSSYIPTEDVKMGELSAQKLEELLHSLDGVGQSAELQREEWCPWKPAGEL